MTKIPTMDDVETGSNYDTHQNTLSQLDDDSSTIVTNAMGIEPKRNPREQQLAAKESRKVRKTKFFLLIFLLIIMICVSVAAHYMISSQEYEEFVHQFNDDSHKILSTIGSNFVRTLQASDALVVSITSVASVTNQKWPFVVVPDFAVRAEKIRSLANAVYVSTYHFVQPNERQEWEKFTAEKGESMVNESIAAIQNFNRKNWPVVWNYTLWDVIHDYDEFEKENPGQVGVDTKGPWLPMWQTQPTISYEPPYNWDLMSVPLGKSKNTSAYHKLMDTHKVTVTDAYLISYPDDEERLENDKEEAEWISSYLLDGEETMEPISDIYYPILFEANRQIEIDEYGKDQQHDVVAIFSLAVYWRDTIKHILPDSHEGLIVVFENPCNPTFSYQINGPNVTFLGAGDSHDEKYNHMAVTGKLSELSSSAMKESSYSGIQLDDEFCPFQITVYPSDTTTLRHISDTPMYFAVVTVIVFAATALTFIIYDFWVERRQKIIMKTAMSTKRLVTSLFPDVVIDRMLPSLEDSASGFSQPKKLQSFLNRERDDDIYTQSEELRSTRGFSSARGFSRPIADLFPDTTVFFADIAGFTAWSSVREPSHVFVLLETIYGAFDKIARQYGIFKVETIGDSYVAVCGLPEPRKNHAVAMARFSFACVEKMKEKTREMELTLGPGTADLKLRIGLNSGPTIAGVLRGEKARFQLFGDTVNTAARMESTGEPNKIQVSQQTAELLMSAGRESWLTKREELVSAKGKGQLQTYWLTRNRSRSSSTICDISSDLDVDESPTSLRLVSHIPKIQRLIDWNVSIFTALLEEIVALRHSTLEGTLKTEDIKSMSGQKKYIRDEVVETILMPDYSSNAVRSTRTFQIDPKAIKQLRDFITRIANFYHTENDFHNFEHASHVIMSTVKLLQRIASPDVRKKDFESEQDYYNYTFGIGSDPLTKFAIVFSALIHDVDHQGVSNFQLSKERDPIAKAYDNKSVLEQHSLDLAWSLLEESNFADLRRCIFQTQAEYQRFRQLSINCVIATDIFDKEMKMFRDIRWEKAFRSKYPSQGSTTDIDDWNRKATIVIECIIQASDVSHTMQHWHVYQKWNRCLFNEMYIAYENGRSDKNPATSWYEGELGFFDNYIIPLATKLRECEVFGVSCDEFLNFAKENRNEWAVKGKDIVSQMLQDAENKVEKDKEMSFTKYSTLAEEIMI